jgi:hypothetical protein
LPFRFDPADPQAGLKAAWSLRYRDFSDTVRVWNTFRLLLSGPLAEREMENYYVVAYGMHRPQRGINLTNGKKMASCTGFSMS